MIKHIVTVGVFKMRRAFVFKFWSMDTVIYIYPLVPVIVELALMLGNVHCVILVDIIWMLICFGDWHSTFMIQEV